MCMPTGKKNRSFAALRMTPVFRYKFPTNPKIRNILIYVSKQSLSFTFRYCQRSMMTFASFAIRTSAWLSGVQLWSSLS